MNRTDKRIAVFIGKVLRAHRRAKDITADKIASKMNVTPVTISKYERGEINIPFTKLIRWCRALKVDSGKISRKAQSLAIKGR